MEDSPLFEFESIMLNADCNGEEFSSTSDCALRPWAFRASLTPCVHTYGRASIKNQILEEEILNTTYLQWVNMSHGYSLYYSLAGDLPSIQGIDCSSSAIPSGKKTQATSLFQSGMRYINNSDPAINDKDILWYDPACTYEFGFIPAQAIVDYLRMFFGTRHYNVMALSAPYGHPNNTEGYIWHQRLYANGTANLTSTRAYMESLANKMSAIIRQRGDDSPITPLQGEVQVVQTCIHVQWWWLALPIALLLLAILFFVTTIVISQRPLTSVAGRAERRPWKSSCLPLLWCGLDDQTRRRYGPLNNLTEMEDCADDLKVTLIRKHDPMDGGRWTLSEQQYRKRVTTI
ncbi:hypothetical protein H2198_001405 [Neophaeococcomyces mojaviensis]|uniref:Uncharacterized protein n=1 Tax=Neophaeococcomyces mojaviensis TaxID=3383035 RepID=A0ACC3AHU8_9EURO|nr:hypothetical protein H2198_001405 [Knufia sp. JES_112]